MNSILNFFLPISIGFYLIYISIKSLDNILNIKKNGYKTRAKVIEIREVSNHDDSDKEISYQINNKNNYYYTVKFNDKRGREIIQELKYPVLNKPNRNPVFEIDILYISKRNEVKEIILVENKGRNSTFYFTFMIGLVLLVLAISNYNGEIDLILDFINNIFNEKNNNN